MEARNREILEDRDFEEVILDGAYISDVPSFYLSLGEAINGDSGYFGANLDALDDCLCGGFGAKRPFTIQIINGEGVEDALDEMAWVRFDFERRLRSFDETCCEGQLKEWGVFDAVELTGKSYYQALVEVLESHGVCLRIYD